MEYIVNIIVCGLIVLAAVNGRDRNLFESAVHAVSVILAAILAVRYWPVATYLLSTYIIPHPIAGATVGFWAVFIVPYLLIDPVAAGWARATACKFPPLVQNLGGMAFTFVEITVGLSCLLMTLALPLRYWTTYDTTKIIVRLDQQPLYAYRALQKAVSDSAELHESFNEFPEKLLLGPVGLQPMERPKTP